MADTAGTQTTLPLAEAKGDGAAATGAPDKGATGAAKEGERAGLLGDAAGKDAGGKAEAKDGQGSKGADAAKAAKGPEGELVLKLPDGVTADPTYVAEFTKAAKEVGINSEQASKLAALDLARQAAATDSAVKAWEAQDDKWTEEIKNDKDIGGDKLAASKLEYLRAMKAYGGPEVEKELAAHGLQNNPVLMRMFVRMGRATKEDNSGGDRRGNGAADAPLTYEQKLAIRYPSVGSQAQR